MGKDAVQELFKKVQNFKKVLTRIMSIFIYNLAGSKVDC
jgi:hypothetical protein